MKILCVLRAWKVSETISGYGRCESRVSICSAICAEGSRWWETGQTRSLTARRAGLVNRHFAQNYKKIFVQYAQIPKCQVADCTNLDHYFCANCRIFVY